MKKAEAYFKFAENYTVKEIYEDEESPGCLWCHSWTHFIHTEDRQHAVEICVHCGAIYTFDVVGDIE